MADVDRAALLGIIGALIVFGVRVAIAVIIAILIADATDFRLV